MRPEPFEMPRFWLGDTPLVFLVEVALRMLVLYGVLVLSLRLMGRRMSSQLTRNELLALVALAAGIGPAVQDPDQGLIAPLIIAVWVVVVQRGLAFLTFRSRRFDALANGNAEVLIHDGRLQLQALHRNAISRERVFAELRSHGLLQLGAVERLYIEPDGSFSLVRGPDGRPGLSIVPAWDPTLADEQTRDPRMRACACCGALRSKEDRDDERCADCHKQDWKPAVVS
jgi:uncharacterized membrane protein YcaP (DUF421 family)